MSAQFSSGGGMDNDHNSGDLHILDEPVSPMIACSFAAFHRDLPVLLKTHYRQWVAYHGDRQLGFAPTETELFEKCLRMGLKGDEFLVCSVEPEVPDDEVLWSHGA